MLARGSGHVVNTASVAGTWAYTWDATPYITSKFAAYGYSEALAAALKPQGIGVSVLCPGLVTTNLAETARSSGVPPELQGQYFYFPPEMQVPVTPEAVGVLVADAIERDQFVIFTHPEDAERFTTWHADIETSLNDVIAATPAPPRILLNLGRGVTAKGLCGEHRLAAPASCIWSPRPPPRQLQQVRPTPWPFGRPTTCLVGSRNALARPGRSATSHR